MVSQYASRCGVFIAVVLACMTGAPTLAADHDTGPRLTQSFNFDWQFRDGDHHGAARPGFDDSQWRTVNLPHDFVAEKPCRKDASSDKPGGYRPLGVGWYRKTFNLPAAMRDRRVLLRFDGIMYEADVYLNGEKLGHQSFPYLTTQFDITDKVNRTGKNVVAVRADASDQRERWYHGGGIYRHTWLIGASPLRVKQFGTYITTPYVSRTAATVNVRTELVNQGDAAGQAALETVILGPDDEPVARHRASFDIGGGATRPVEQALRVRTPRLWSTDQPHLYRAVSRVYRGDELVDEYTSTFGIRTFAFSPDQGFLLNGEKLLMQGVCLHQDIAPFGSAVPNRAMERQLRKLKAMGVNAIRTAHNPYSIDFLNLCDRLGLVVIDEVFDKWHRIDPSGGPWEDNLRRFVIRDRNHPSIVLWSVGNEVSQQNNDEGVAIYNAMADVVRQLDPTRPATAGLHPRKHGLEPPKMAFEMDVVCQNYQSQMFPYDHEKYPDMVLLESESQPYFTYNIKTRSEDGKYLEQIPYFHLEDYACGHFHWTGWEYLGEAVSGWPRAGWVDAMFDNSGRRKAYSWFFEALYRPDAPIVHIAVRGDDRKVRGKAGWQWPNTRSHWNWNPGEGEVEVNTFTNAHEVELILNGESLGTKKLADFPERLMAWRLTPEHGTIHAIARDADGEVVAEHKLRTAGEPKQLRLEVDQPRLAADGQDLAHVRVWVEDAHGVRVPDARDLIRFEVSGAAELAGVCNGSNLTDVVYSADEVKAWRGEAVAVLRATMEPGRARLKVSADGLADAAVQIETVKR